MSARKTKLTAIILMIFCTLFTSLGQILWKLGVLKINLDQWFSVLNWPFLFGFVAYAVGAVFMLLAFRKGELSILYPIIATSYVWVSIISPLLFANDFMNVLKWSGVGLILLSVSLLGLAGTRNQGAVNG